MFSDWVSDQFSVDFYIFPEYSEAYKVKNIMESKQGCWVSPRGKYINGEFQCWVVDKEQLYDPEITYVKAEDWLEDYKRYNGDT